MEKKWIAILDETKLLVGFDKDPDPEEIPKEAVTVPEGCDLKLGGYRWDGKAFWPVGGGDKILKEKLERKIPEYFFLLLSSLEKQGIKMDPEIREWIGAYKVFVEKEKK